MTLGSASSSSNTMLTPPRRTLEPPSTIFAVSRSTSLDLSSTVLTIKSPQSNKSGFDFIRQNNAPPVLPTRDQPSRPPPEHTITELSSIHPEPTDVSDTTFQTHIEDRASTDDQKETTKPQWQPSLNRSVLLAGILTESDTVPSEEVFPTTT